MQPRLPRVGVVISIATDATLRSSSLRSTSLFPRVLALDVLEKGFAGRRCALKFFSDRFRDGEVPINTRGLEFDFERLAGLIVADGGDVAGIDGLALHFHRGNSSTGELVLKRGVSMGLRQRHHAGDGDDSSNEGLLARPVALEPIRKRDYRQRQGGHDRKDNTAGRC
jgi:hypothetical protein